MPPLTSFQANFIFATLSIVIAICTTGCRNATVPPTNITKQRANRTPLKLVRVLPIENIREPSGLTIHRNQLFTVSDEDDATIFRLRLDDKVAVAEPIVKIKLPAETERLDLEGITIDNDDFLVLAEAARRVFRITPNGEIVSTQNIEDFATDQSFATPGAGPEGLAVVGGTTIVAAERQPCSLLVLDTDRKPRPIDADDNYPQLPPRPKDATGLWVEQDELWCLSRNGESIIRFDTNDHTLPILGIFSFQHHAIQLTFSDNTFGTAEGLAADADHIYVVFDNNDLTAKNDPTDLRPRIAIFHRP